MQSDNGKAGLGGGRDKSGVSREAGVEEGAQTEGVLWGTQPAGWSLRMAGGSWRLLWSQAQGCFWAAPGGTTAGRGEQQPPCALSACTGPQPAPEPPGWTCLLSSAPWLSLFLLEFVVKVNRV